MDNDQDGCADDPAVLKKLTTKDANGKRIFMMFTDDLSKNGEYLKLFLAKGYQMSQAVEIGECSPKCAGLNYGKDACQDSTTEESLHMITAIAYTSLYPKMLQTEFGKNSSLNKGLDLAR